jgi:ATP-dependent helicase HepA
MSQFTVGQRWLSETEPELGLGTVLNVQERLVGILFPASGELRNYASDSAPLKRVQFRPGASIRKHDGTTFVLESVSEESGLFHYYGEGCELLETDLCDSISFNAPEDRLLHGHLAPSSTFDLRYETLCLQHQSRKSPIRGFVGGRIDLIPHQLYIAHEVTSRQAPRVLLADEVGLGKTIEAGLILHRMQINGRLKRILILLPEALIHQWFVELLRRFNMQFNIFDSSRCAAHQQTNPEANPFFEAQLVICSLDFLAGNAQRQEQAVQAEWDMLVVDEAHHLGWTPEASSPGYELVERLSRHIPGLLLLTATPEQIGQASHFARLRLLDPDRFYDLQKFCEETRAYRGVAGVVNKLLGQSKLTNKDQTLLASLLPDSTADLERRLEEIREGSEPARQQLIGDLQDLHGTGRVMFRNTRARMSGFPKRQARLASLPCPGHSPRLSERLLQEAMATLQPQPGITPDYQFDCDPRLPWLCKLLQTIRPEKVLLICNSLPKVLAIESALRQLTNVKLALFHEELPLIQRDRNAAWFAEADGAQILLCSEIGSEGRNFQFAHHLVLFDLPASPELLEQRIGRLDRIGQTHPIEIHVPCIAGSPQEDLAAWYHQGLNAFEQNQEGGNQIWQRFRHTLAEIVLRQTKTARSEKLKKLIGQTREYHQELMQQLKQGRDRLLELNSFKPEITKKLIREIRACDRDRQLEKFTLKMFEHFGVEMEELEPRTYLLKPGNLFTDAFPELPPEGLTVTADRTKALRREDIGLLSWDHPIVIESMGLLLGSEQGNCAFAAMKHAEKPALLLEAIYVLECLAPPALHASRFLPPTPVRVVINHLLQDCSRQYPSATFENRLSDIPAYQLLDTPAITQDLLPEMLSQSQQLAEERQRQVIEQATAAMETDLTQETQRLLELQRVNPAVREGEIELSREQIRHLRSHMASARLRLDAIRLIRALP